jgi:pyruvate/2-oxoglutarate dehydrogenase complex dihydrolipoamide acyltransferase (E2) component
MPVPVPTPRINNNDDTVRLAAVLVPIGSKVRIGDPILDVETDKATFTVEAPVEGYLLKVSGEIGQMLDVGATVAWIGATPDEAAGDTVVTAAANGTSKEPTLKALLLLKQYGLRAADITPSSGRLTAEDVERAYQSQRGARQDGPAWKRLGTPGRMEPFTREQRGMFQTVTWHQKIAVPGYIEIPYDPSAWDDYAAEFMKSHGLLFSPLLALMSWRLSRLALEKPRLNALAWDEGMFHFANVNLGFMVQSGETLYMVVVRESEKMDEPEFVSQLGELQRAAMKRTLKPEQTSDATLSFSSMARWNVSRHIPILSPFTSMMVAHTASSNGSAILGATYDHRLLTGFDVVQALMSLSTPK